MLWESRLKKPQPQEIKKLAQSLMALGLLLKAGKAEKLAIKCLYIKIGS
jgi:hypothetical protein